MVLPFRTNYYCDYAKFFEEAGLLRLIVLGTRRPIEGIPRAKQILQPLFGLWFYLAARLLSPYHGETVRFGTYPLFDFWASTKIRPGDSVFSSYGYANRCFHLARRFGGMTFLDAGNSHPENFWKILSEEHRRWGCRHPPVSPAHYQRSVAMMKEVDWVLAPSRFVENSFLINGFSGKKIFRIPYATDLSVFRQGPERHGNRPFTVINTGGLSLRKGTPYLLEALRSLREKIPKLRILLTRQISDNIKPILAKYNDLPIDWSETLPPALLAERLRSADLFILPSLEEGMARTALEAMACGLPVILTPNTGACDLVEEGHTGSIVPIRDSEAMVKKAVDWWEKIEKGRMPTISSSLLKNLSKENFKINLSSAINNLI
jgi:glycosyltransferase involved in cell wall biosynthesis